MNKSTKKTKTSLLKYRRIIVKLGTRLMTGGSKQHLDMEIMSNITRQIAELHQQGIQVVIVSSGAVAAGRHKLGIEGAVKGIPYKQVLASVGQGRLMNTYEQLFDAHHITVAQALLTKSDIAERAGYLNARNTLIALMELGVICIVNENDVVSADEIKENKFGENDILSAMVANLIDADMLMILSDTGGLFTADPKIDPSAHLIPTVGKIDASIKRLCTDSLSGGGTGGMITKVEAARLATSTGVRVVIAAGKEPGIILKLAAGEARGTQFLPTITHMESRRRWMVSGLCTKGKLNVDSGAANALKKQNRSLLAAGIKNAEGKFGRGDIVAIFDTEGAQIGCGIVNYSSSDINLIKGTQSANIAGLVNKDYGPEVIHRNNLALLEREDQGANRQTL
jgi:glutamate 5-kinase